MTQSTWLVRLVRHLPYPLAFIETVRVGLDVKTWVRVRICNINFGIWKWPAGD